MSQKSYTVLWKQIGLAANAQMAVRVVNVSNGDFINVNQDLTKITQAAFIGISGQANNILASIASTQWPSAGFTCLTITSLASPAVSFAADACDILLYGPNVAAS